MNNKKGSGRAKKERRIEFLIMLVKYMKVLNVCLTAFYRGRKSFTCKSGNYYKN